MKPRRSILDSFNYAFDGIVYAFKTQPNMRIHFLVATLVLIASLIFKLTKLEILMLFLTISFVLVAEMINTAIEAAIDLVTQDYHPIAAIAKNVAAGAVLVASTVSVIVGYLIFYPKFDSTIPRVVENLKRTPAYLSLVAVLLTITLVIIGKAFTKRGRPVKGGMPSGHSALGASAATTVVFLAQNSLITLLSMFLFFLIAESRVENRIHTFDEVLAGGLLGFLVTLILFQLIR